MNCLALITINETSLTLYRSFKANKKNVNHVNFRQEKNVKMFHLKKKNKATTTKTSSSVSKTIFNNSRCFTKLFLYILYNDGDTAQPCLNPIVTLNRIV